MDKRDELAKKCLLIKSVPKEIGEETIKRSIERLTKVVRVCRYTEYSDESTRFIVQLQSREDACKLIQGDDLSLITEAGQVKVNVGFCPECILSNEWLENRPCDTYDDENHLTGNKKDTEQGHSHSKIIRNFTQETSDQSSDESEEDPDQFVNNLCKEKSDWSSHRHRSAEIRPRDHHRTTEVQEEHNPSLGRGDENLHFHTKTPIEDLIQDDMDDYGRSEIPSSFLHSESLYEPGDSEQDVYVPSLTIPAKPIKQTKSQGVGNVETKEAEMTSQGSNREEQNDENLSKNKVTPTEKENVKKVMDGDISKISQGIVSLDLGQNNDNQRVRNETSPLASPREDVNPRMKAEGNALNTENEITTIVMSKPKSLTSGQNNPGVDVTDHQNSRQFKLQEQNLKIYMQSSAVGNDTQTPSTNQTVSSEEQSKQELYPKVPSDFEQSNVVTQFHSSGNTGNVGHVHTDQQRYLMHQQVTGQNPPSPYNPYNVQFTNMQQGQRFYGPNQQMQVFGDPYRHPPPFVVQYPPSGMNFPVHQPLQPGFNPVMQQPNQATNLYGVQPLYGHSNAGHQSGGPSAPPPTYSMVQRGDVTLINPSQQQHIVPSVRTPTNSILTTEVPSAYQTSHSMAKSKDDTKDTEEHNISKSQIEEEECLKKLYEWSHSGDPGWSTVKGENLSNQMDIGKDIKDQAAANIETIQQHVKRKTGSADRQKSPEPMEWEHSSSAGARQKHLSTKDTKKYSYKQARGDDDTDSDGYESIADYIRDWALDDSQTELNFGFIKIIKGEIATMKTDVIVNSSNTDLDLRVGKVSRSLVKAGGEKIQQECKKKYKNGITQGEIACTRGGNLKCRRLFHCIAPKWDGGSGTATKDLEELIRKCMQKAEKKLMKSIAFPALGSGQLGFPVDTVAYTLISTTKQHMEVASSVTAVFLVLHPTDRKALKAFDRTSYTLLGPPYTKSVSDEDSANYEKLEEFDDKQHEYVKFKTSEQRKQKSHRKPSQEEEHLYESIYPGKQEEPLYMSMKGQMYMSMKPRSSSPSGRLRITWTSDLTLDDLTLYFENERKSGGGDIKSHDIYLEMKEGMIEFEKPETVDHILKKGTDHTVNKSIVKVQKVTSTESTGLEERKVLVDGLNPKTTEDCLRNFLEAKTKAELDTLMYSDTKERAVVSFTQEPDISKLRSACEEKKLEGHTLKISKVPICRSILVTGLQGNVSEDTVWYFFENSTRCDGGDVEKVEFNVEDDTAVVFFVDPKVARQVVETKKRLQLGGSSVHVSLFYPFLRCEKPKVKLPDPIILSDIDPNIIKFILNSKVNRESLLNALGKENAALDIIKEKEFKISCNLDPDSKNIATVVKLWKNQVQKVVKKLLDALVTEEVPVLDKAWNGVLQRLKGLVISHPDGVAVVLNTKDYTVIVVGHKHFVLELKQTIEELVKKTEDEMKQQLELVTKKEHLKMYQIHLLWRSKFPMAIKNAVPKLEVEINGDNKQITFTGNLKDVEEGRVKMHEKLESFVSDQVEISAGRKEVFLNGPGKIKFAEETKRKRLFLVWNFSSQTLHLFGVQKKEIRQGIDIFKSCLQEEEVVLKDQFEKFIASTHWQKTLRDIQEKYENRFSINSENNKICVTATNDVFKDVFSVVDKEVKEFVRLHEISTEFFFVEEGMMQFMKQHQQVGISSIRLSLKDIHLKLEERQTKRKNGYNIKGTKDGICIAKKKLKTLMDCIKNESHKISSFGAFDFFTSQEGLDKVRTIESVNTCVIRRKTDVMQNRKGSRMPSAPPVIRARCKVGDNKLISVALGDMTQLSVDVMVNAANEDLQHGAGLAKAIVDAGGQEIQLECSSYVKKHGRLSTGEAVGSGAGRLPCRMVVHAVGPTWVDGKSGEEGDLRNAVRESLKLARKYKSIAFPALSAGIFGCPLEFSVKCIVDEVDKFLSRRNVGELTRVFFCDMRDSTVVVFVQELKNVYSSLKVEQSISDNDDSDGSSSDAEANDNSNIHEHRSKVKPSIKILLVKGEIARMKADVIVNSTQHDLNLDTGALSKSILQHGGHTLQHECNKNYPNGIKPGQIAVTSGGKLSCQQVYHGTFPQWNKGDDVCQKLLQDFVTLCLTTADKSGLTSVAFPALGAGQLRWPPKTVASIMYRSVMDYSWKHPHSSLPIVTFVVFPTDVNTVQAFEQQEDIVKQGYVKAEQSDVPSPAAHREHTAGPSRLGHFRVTVKTGDITKEKVDAIVNSTNDSLDLSKGAISRAILQAAGKSLQDECDKQRTGMKKDGLIFTTGGKLPCSVIFHVRSHPNPGAWEQSVTDCLHKADSIQLKSIAFPALGTGQASCDPKEMARTIFRAIRLFKGPTSRLKEVRIVIFQSDMASVFQSELTQQLAFGDKEPASKYHRGHPHSDIVEFLIWSDSESKMIRAKGDLDKALDQDIRKEIIKKNYSDVIRALTETEVKKLHAIAAENKTKFEFSQGRGMITIVGRNKYVSKCILDITNQLREYEKYKDKVQLARTMANYVQWYYDDGSKIKKYDVEVNYEIEIAYKNKQTTVKVKDGHGEFYIINFNKMEQCEEKNRNSKIKVKREEKGASSSGNSLPKSWTVMNKDESVKRVLLSTSDHEYVQIANKFSTGAGCQPIQIVRIQNKHLYQQFAAKRDELRIKNKKDPEQLLWHGTSADTVDKIITNGFNRSYCGKNGTAFGNGVYFAVNSSLSVRYSGQSHYGYLGSGLNNQSGGRHIFLVQVLTGETCCGRAGMTVLPCMSGTTTYDSATDNMYSPSMYVIFHDSQAYPKYHITF